MTAVLDGLVSVSRYIYNTRLRFCQAVAGVTYVLLRNETHESERALYFPRGSLDKNIRGSNVS